MISILMNNTVTIKNSAEKNLLVIEATKKEILRGLSILLLVIETFLFLRVILELFGSNPSSIFAGFVYLISGIFLLPFYDIFPQFSDTITAGRPTFDAPASIAIFCYLLFIPLIMAVVWIITTMLKTGKQVNETVEKDNLVDPTKVDEIVK